MIGKSMIIAGAVLVAIFANAGARSGLLDTQASRSATLDGFKSAFGWSYGGITNATQIHSPKFEVSRTKIVQASFETPPMPPLPIVPAAPPQPPAPPVVDVCS